MKTKVIGLSLLLIFYASISIGSQEITTPEQIYQPELSEQLKQIIEPERIKEPEQIKQPAQTEHKKLKTETTENKTQIFPVTIGGYFQMWYINEQVENGKQQDVTNDKAVQEASGFSINKARLYVEREDSITRAKIELRLEGGSVGLLDAYAFFKAFDKMLQAGFGQMKIPSTYEVATSDSSLDFTTRNYFSSVVTNWSLSKSTSTVSPFYGVQTYQRDAGAALKGVIYGLNYFFMVGNGLGANLFVGGEENKQFVYANKYGAYFYAGRLSFDIMNPLGKKLLGDIPINTFSIGGHYNKNNHPNILYNDKKSVLDIKRKSWSCDANIIFFDRVRLTAMYGKGVINDDFDYNGETDYKYSGYELKAVVEIIKDKLETGIRYDEYTEENAIYGAPETYYTYTAGMTYNFKPHFRFQFNYKWKYLDSELNNDLKDNIMTIAGQYQF